MTPLVYLYFQFFARDEVFQTLELNSNGFDRYFPFDRGLF